MTRERGVRSNAMVVFMQVAIMSGNGRNANIMHDGAPQRLSWLRFEKHSFFFLRPPRIVNVIRYVPAIVVSAWELGYLSGP